jgi:hypothetical protein
MGFSPSGEEGDAVADKVGSVVGSVAGSEVGAEVGAEVDPVFSCGLGVLLITYIVRLVKLCELNRYWCTFIKLRLSLIGVS